MRIISHLVPDGQPISTDIEGNRRPGQTMWKVPTWGRPLALGVYPLFIRKHRSLVPAGTGFCISKAGFGITSLLQIREAVRRCEPGGIQRGIEALFADDETEEKGIAVLHHRVISGNRFSGYLADLTLAASAGTADVCYVFPQFRQGYPYLPLPLTFAVPRQGSRVVCAGYSTPPEDVSFPLDDIESGRINLLDVFEHNLLAVEGRVAHVFTRRFAPGSVGGPCFTIDAGIREGMGGGPVFSENGYVCGFLSADASRFFNKPAGIVSLLRPALGMNIRLGGRVGKVRLSADRRLIDLIQQGVVTTDGSEQSVSMSRVNSGVLPDIGFAGEDADRVHADFAGFQESRPATEEFHGKQENP